MPRIIVTRDSGPSDSSALLDELVYSVHLNSEQAARQLIERLSWAIADAERPDQQRSHASVRQRRVRARRPAVRTGQPV